MTRLGLFLTGASPTPQPSTLVGREPAHSTALHPCWPHQIPGLPGSLSREELLKSSNPLSLPVVNRGEARSRSQGLPGPTHCSSEPSEAVALGPILILAAPPAGLLGAYGTGGHGPAGCCSGGQLQGHLSGSAVPCWPQFQVWAVVLGRNGLRSAQERMCVRALLP